MRARCSKSVSFRERRPHACLNALLAHLNEQQRRWLVGTESLALGRGGDRRMSLITGMNVETIRRGRREVDGHFGDYEPGRIRKRGAGRPKRCSPQTASTSLQSMPAASNSG
jgi:hypothetical protein